MHNKSALLQSYYVSIKYYLYNRLSLLGLGIPQFIIFRVTEQFITFYSDG